MALTQVKTSGLADDAVTGAKIADDTVAEANMANDAISLAELKAGTDGQIITYDASGNPTAVGPGTDGQVLTSTGAGSPPAFETLPASNNYSHPNHSGDVTSSGDGATTIANDAVTSAKIIDNAVTLAKMAGLARGKLIYGDSSGNPAALTVGSANQVLTADGTDVAWAAAAGGGKLLQVVGNDASTHTTINTTTKTSTGLLQSITPTKTGSKMIFMCAGHYSQNTGTGSHGPQVIVSIYKQIGSGTDTEIHQVTYDYIGEVASVYYSHHFAATYFDPTATLNTTDAIKYTIYAKMLNADHAMRFNPSGRTSLIVMEYDA